MSETLPQTIILIHCLRGEHHGLSAIAKNLRPTYRTLVPDLPGSGDRLELDNKTLDGYADWLHYYIKSQDLPEKPIIAGHSMGSIVVSYFVTKYPKDVDEKVLLLSPIFRTKRSQKHSNRTYKLTTGALKLLPKNRRYQLLKSKKVSFCIATYLTCDKTKLKHIRQLHYRYSGRFASADSLMADMKISMQSQVVIPPKKAVLLCIGAKDQLTSPKLAEQMANEYHCDFVEIPGSGHLINYEKPALVARAMMDFIAKPAAQE